MIDGELNLGSRSTSAVKALTSPANGLPSPDSSLQIR